MKTKLFSFFLALMASLGTMFASVTVDGIAYNLNETELTAEVTQGGSYSGSIIIPESIIYDTKTYRVTSIGNKAFYQCTKLTSVIISNSITSIGDRVFEKCTSLTSVTIGNSVTSIGQEAFRNCSSLTSVTIGNSVTSIGEKAFYHCTELTSVTIPNSVTTIERQAFSDCSSLKKVNISDLTAWCNIIFTDNKSNPLSCAEHLCLNSVEIIDLVIPNTVTSIRDYAFYNCSSLTSVTIGNSVINVGDSTFYGCSSLSSVTIPNSVSSIGNGAFYGCSSLTSVTIPNSVTSIGYRAFYNCSSLTDIYATCDDLEKVKQLLNNDNRVKYAPSPYTVTVKSNGKGEVTIPSYTSCDKTIQIIVTANYGYHFFKWNDGNTDNPRTIELTQDTTFTAEFAPDQYSINVSCDEQFGHIEGESGEFDYMSKHVYKAIANYGYHFVYWSDGYEQNPRTITLTEDISISAKFAKNLYTISDNSNKEQGHIEGVGTYEYLEEIILTPINEYGYHFTQWSDGNTDNPRTIELTQDTTFTAEFAPNQYSINVSCDEQFGHIEGENGEFDYMSEHIYEAVANYGYHFVRWSDGNMQNPRTITVTKDISISAEFAKNLYTISDNSNQTQGHIQTQGHVIESITYDISQYTTGDIAKNKNLSIPVLYVAYLNGSCTSDQYCEIRIISPSGKNYTIGAHPNNGNYFGRSTSPFYGNFLQNEGCYFFDLQTIEKGVWTLTFVQSNAGMWYYYYNTPNVFAYLSELTLTAISNYGCHFAQWSDGNTENPRSIILTQDTTFIAEFAIDKSGTCGDDNALTWTFDDKGVLTISGNGALNSNYTFGLEAPESMQKVIIESGVSSVGNSAFKDKTTLTEIAISHGVNTIQAEAFAGCTELATITLGASLQSIGENAFIGCKRIDEITVYAERVIDITETTFANVGNKKYIYVNVPEGSLRKYQRDDYWSEFDLRIIGATTTTVADDEVNVQPTSNTADVTWPAVENAATYELTIKDKNGNVICTLVFNAQGQLTSIAFAAPGRGQYAAQVAGFTFTVTGLDSGSSYSFTMEAKDSQGEVIDTKEGTFTTTESGIATALDNASLDSKPVKIIRNGQLFILRGDKTYTIQGQEVR